MGGAAAILSRGRALALAGLLAVLVAYDAVAEEVRDLPARFGVAVVAFLVLPAFMAAIWLALPLVRLRRPYLLLVAAAAAGLASLVLDVAGVESGANVTKFACFALVGLWFVSLFEELWWVALVAVLVPWMDVWSVIAGPTRYVIEERPGFFAEISVAFAVPGGSASFNLGPPDVIFFALFLATAACFRLRVAWTWIAMTGFLAVTLVVVWEWDVAGLPALPAVCLGFLAPNADLVWRNVQDARRAPPRSDPSNNL